MTTYTVSHTATVTSITGVNGETGATVGTVDVSNTTHTNAGTYAGDYWIFTGTANYNDIGNDDDHRLYRQGERGGGGDAVQRDLRRQSAHGDRYVDHRCERRDRGHRRHGRREQHDTHRRRDVSAPTTGGSRARPTTTTSATTTITDRIGYGTCTGSNGPGGQILPPINVNGTSV